MTTDWQWVKKKTQNPEVCAKCGGICCKKCGCSFMPYDLEMTFDFLIHNIKEGLIRIDMRVFRVNGVKKKIYYFRVANVLEKADESINGFGSCIFLTPHGCILQYEERPSCGKYVVPFQDGYGCYCLINDDEFAIAWDPYQDLIKQILEKIKMGY